MPRSPESNLYIGLISGTSMDSLDVALAAIEGERFEVRETYAAALPAEVRQTLLGLCAPGEDELNRLAQAGVEFAEFCAATTLDALARWRVDPPMIAAIGSHGQTVRHAPRAHPPYSVQLGDPSVLAERTGITTVADFRARDIAAGGEGAPLVPAFHAAVFRSATRDRAVVNIGGMANVTLLPARGEVSGFDTGPGNMLLDLWHLKENGAPYDRDGAFARTGCPSPELLAALAADEFFARPPPKSTGREYFDLQWLLQRLPAGRNLPSADVAATLVELTAKSIAEAIAGSRLESPDILVCGGGGHNRFLMERLAALARPAPVGSTTEKGIDGDFVEACAFAWLAWRTLNGEPGNLPAVTGARGERILGGIYAA